MLTKACTDRFRLEQEDKTHDALRPQSLPRQQHQRRRAPPHAQQNLRRRDRTRRIFPKESRDHRQGQGFGCQGHQPQGPSHQVIVEGRYAALIRTELVSRTYM